VGYSIGRCSNFVAPSKWKAVLRPAEYFLLEGDLQEGILPECDPHEDRFGGAMFVGKENCRKASCRNVIRMKTVLAEQCSWGRRIAGTVWNMVHAV
jgi:hypothetical protein